MAFTFKPAGAPPATTGGNYTKLPTFVGKLIVVVPYEKTLSKFKDDNGKPQEQTRSTVIAIQGGTHTADDGEETTWEAGDIYDVFVSQKKVQAQTSELNVPVLGRLLKDGKAWVLNPPTEAEVKQAEEVLKNIELPDRSASKKKTEDASSEVPW